MKTIKMLLPMICLFYSASVFAKEAIQVINPPSSIEKFDLAKHKSSTEAQGICVECAKKAAAERALIATVEDPEFIRATKPEFRIVETTVDANGKTVVHDPVYASTTQFGDDNDPKNERILGMTQKTSLLMSKDDLQTMACSVGHDQGDMANRWCHGSIAQNFNDWVKRRGVNPTASNFSGLLLLFMKEKVVDLNTSSHDLVQGFDITTGDRSSLRITVYGDAIMDNHARKVSPLSGSTPFFTFTRKLGPKSRN